jgi:hypothetical protein
MSDTLKQIADNLGVTTINGNYLSGIADYYGVDLATSTDLMADILTEVGGDPSTSTDYLQDIVLALGGTVTINGNWMEAWEAITSGPPVPVNTVAPALDFTGLGGENTVTSDEGSWTGSPTSFTYQWYRVPQTGGSNTAIVGETSASYTLQLGDVDYLVTCQLTAINATGSSTPEPSNECYVYDEDYYFNIWENGYDGSTEQSYLQNRLMMGLKTSGAWAKLDYFNLYAIDGDGTSLINWKNGSNDATREGAVHFELNQGYVLDGIDSYIDTKFNLSTEATNYTLNNASRYFFPFDLTSGPLDGYEGGGGGTANRMVLANTAEQRINQGSANINSAFEYTTTVNAKSIHRTTATDITLFNGTTSAARTATSTSIRSSDQLIGRSTTGYAEAIVAGYAMGASMVSENTAFVAAFNAYITAL